MTYLKRIIGLFFIMCLVACNQLQSSSHGGSSEWSYDVTYPFGWRNTNLGSGSEKITLAGPEGEIHIEIQASLSETSVIELAQEFVEPISGDNLIAAYSELEGQHDDLVFVELDAVVNGISCYAVFSHADGRLIVAKAYPKDLASRNQIKDLCRIFREVILSYETCLGPGEQPTILRHDQCR